ncbi:MAG TPA: serine hydrolase [Dehalococcoidia bacterium]|nr:serine hydrolase [Dehalococcoidia bacterium]
MTVRRTARLRRSLPPPPRQPGRRPARVPIPLGLAVGALALAAVFLAARWATDQPGRDDAAADAAPSVRSAAIDQAPIDSGSAAAWLVPDGVDRYQAQSASPAGLRSVAARIDLESQLATWVAGRPGTYGIVVIDLATDARYALNPSEPFPPASLHKLLIMAEVYRQVEAGDLTLEDRIVITPEDSEIGEPAGGLPIGAEVTVNQAVTAMAEVSSNAAAAALVRRLSPAAVGQAAEWLGLRDTRFDPARDRQAVTTAADQAEYFERLVRGQIVSREASQQILNHLARSQLNNRLPAGLPPGTVVAHKTGDLEGFVHDAGVVYGPRGPIVVALLSGRVGNGQATTDLRLVSKLIYDVLLDQVPPAR